MRSSARSTSRRPVSRDNRSKVNRLPRFSAESVVSKMVSITASLKQHLEILQLISELLILNSYLLSTFCFQQTNSFFSNLLRMIQLPENQDLPVGKLTSVFRNVTNSYKYYWFLTILELVEDSKSDGTLRLEEISLRMLSNVWYPLNFYKLSFGKQDGFGAIAQVVNSVIDVDNSSGSASLYRQITEKLSIEKQKELSEKVKILLRWVPYRFQRPFLSEDIGSIKDSKVNEVIVEYATRSFTRGDRKAMYSFSSDGTIQIQPEWLEYLRKNCLILKGFVYWELSKFVQKNNPNVSGIAEKLLKPTKRNLREANLFWNRYLDLNQELVCIYSDQTIGKEKLSIDHFIPWRYVVHDKAWNLIPTVREVNSSKSDNLPAMDKYLSRFANLHFDAFRQIYSSSQRDQRMLEDYSLIFKDDLATISDYTIELFSKKLSDVINPIYQTATNLGFEPNWIYRSSV